MAANSAISIVGVDWGTTHRRAYAITGEGQLAREVSDADGALACKGRFPSALDAALQGLEVPGTRVVLAGMVGSALGWHEVPYVDSSVPLQDLAAHALRVPDAAPGVSAIIIPGYRVRNAQGVPDVMRGEETQLLGAWALGHRSGWFVLPGTHSKWVELHEGRVVQLRTYMTGELFGHLRHGGSLAQVMPPKDAPETFDADAFDRGVARAGAVDAPSITHLLFGVRSLSLFSKLTPATAPSYLSGLVVGTEMRDALRWTPARHVTAIGSAKLLEAYARAAAYFKITLDRLESDDILPPALFNIACEAGLVARTAG